MAPEPKYRRSAPYTSKVLIPLWILQLSLSVFLFAERVLYIADNAAYSLTTSQKTLSAFEIILSFLVSISIIFSFTKFLMAQLGSRLFLIQSAVATALAAALIIISIATVDWFMALFAGVAMLAGVWLSVYGRIVRMRVVGGEVGEMARPSKIVGEEGGAVELESRDGARGDVGSNALSGLRVEVGEGSQAARPTPSLNSVATGGDSVGPPKDVKEFV